MFNKAQLVKYYGGGGSQVIDHAIVVFCLLFLITLLTFLLSNTGGIKYY
uniref:Uncharacterized protein n=1 Tax=Anguilla anguilla TaxID=7936 RepID=A0A0E9U5S9_ANGAN